MEITEQIALKLRTAQAETGLKVTPDNAVLLMPEGEYIEERILGFDTLCAIVPEITLGIKGTGYGKLIRIFEDS
jgi:hypothetical protein